MPERAPVGGLDDDRLGERLVDALHDRLDPTSVDVPTLLVGSRRRARTVRNRRIAAAGTAAAVLVAAPVAYEVAGRPVAVQDSSAMLSRTPDPVPDALGLAARDLPGLRPASSVSVQGQKTSSLAAALTCAPATALAGPDLPSTGRSWGWVAGSPAAPARQVTVIVTRWSDRGLSGALARSSGCAWSDRPAAFEGTHLGDRALLSTSTHSDLTTDRVLIRAGDLVAGLTVQRAAGAGPEFTRTLAGHLAERLEGRG